VSADVVIAGGGIIGCAIAHALAHAGVGRIVVVERAAPGLEASGAAAGLLAVGSTRAPRGVVFELRRASAAMFPRLVETLRSETGIDVEYSSHGVLELAFTGRDAAMLERLVARRREQGFAVELLDPQQALSLEPAVNSTICGAAHFPDDRSIHNVRLVEALHAAARARGVEFRLGTELHGVEHAKGRVLSVQVGGERLVAGHLIIAAGVWSREVASLLRVKVPVRPDRGEMLALRPSAPLRRIVSWNDGYLVPRGDGEVLVGSTSTRGVAEKVVTASSMALLLSRAVRMVPSLADAALLRTWAGLRPLSTLRRPIIGPLRGFENVTLASGHHRSGILLAPITAKLVAELLVQGATSIPLQPFCYRPR
jgi:glycine oxidase